MDKEILLLPLDLDQTMPSVDLVQVMSLFQVLYHLFYELSYLQTHRHIRMSAR